jgi:hypothetical protein
LGFAIMLWLGKMDDADSGIVEPIPPNVKDLLAQVLYGLFLFGPFGWKTSRFKHSQ